MYSFYLISCFVTVKSFKYDSILFAAPPVITYFGKAPGPSISSCRTYTVLGYPTPNITWRFQGEPKEITKARDSEPRLALVNTIDNGRGVSGMLCFSEVISVITYNGHYMVIATNELGSVNKTLIIMLLLNSKEYILTAKLCQFEEQLKLIICCLVFVKLLQ